MTWAEFYEIWGESESVREVIPHLSSLESVGPEDEVADVVVDLGDECKTAADLLLRIALNQGRTFSGESLMYMEGSCNENLWLQAIHASAKNFTTADLDELLYMLDDDVLMAIAEKYHLALPQDMLEDMAEEVGSNLSYLISEADYALDCLRRAYDSLTYAVANSITEHRSARKGLWGHRYWSRNKYEYAEQAAAELEAAEEALSHLNEGLGQWTASQRQHLAFGSWQKTMDVWGRNSLTGAINSEHIRRTWRRLEQQIPQVEALRDELQKTYDELNETKHRYQENKKRR